ncbi:DUF5996 family protein [Kribbella sp.]|uniref:DUF5996 family protein n=1 Tax=Kribbella sp. TaxID=1871183 RepID=UPI002D5C2D29|nr:DUF5996 family protein [Kribbella sp.]HZX02134.1 DUF5996 family protein [Kribbella sp.]
MEIAAWQPTRDTLHLWTQIVGKVRLALTPHVNHWWNVPLYVNSVGLTTSLMPYRGGGVEITFDFLTHTLLIHTTAGDRRVLRLEPRSVADFYAEFRSALRELDIDVHIRPVPVELPHAIPFDADHEHDSYDPAAVRDFYCSLVHAERVLTKFRSTFSGKVSPVHFFWGAFDLAVTRFSGRLAPRHAGGVPNCPDWVMAEAYSHEVSSCGYWPGGREEGIFYSYAYPIPPALEAAEIRPAAGYYDGELREFVLPYRDVRKADDPDAYLTEFLTSTYDAAKALANWP